jgi:POT family proton-dependent oligopeptide transporter
MGINIGAFLSPLICGYVGENINWHWGFGLAGIGMTFGLVQYVAGGKRLGEAGLHPATPPAGLPAEKRRFRNVMLALAGVGALAAVLSATGSLEITAIGVANAVGVLLLVAFVGVFVWLFGSAGFTAGEKRRFVVILVLCLASALFWAAFEQAGSTLNLFADRSTRNRLVGWEFPSTWYQSANALFIILFAPAYAWLWVRMGRRHIEPSSTTKFGIGLVLVGAGFATLILPAAWAADGTLVSPIWLTLTYLLHTWGELALSPVGLSAMSKLAPVRVGGLVMGVWFLAAAGGNYIGGRMAGLYESMPVSTLFAIVAAFAIVVGLTFLALAIPVGRMERSADAA